MKYLKRLEKSLIFDKRMKVEGLSLLKGQKIICSICSSISSTSSRSGSKSSRSFSSMLQ